MSINNAFILKAKGYDLHTLGWVLGSINWPKLKHRANFAFNNPNKTVKFILLEYDYTSLKDVREQDIENIMDLVPHSGMIANTAIRRPSFMELLHAILTNSNEDMEIYTRKKIENGQINYHRRQLVLHIKPYAFIPKLTRQYAVTGDEPLIIGNKRQRTDSGDSSIF